MEQAQWERLSAAQCDRGSSATFNRIIQELIGPLLATFQCAFVDLDVTVYDLALLDLPVKQTLRCVSLSNGW